MRPYDYSAGLPREAGGQRNELINRAALAIIADAWNRYPSEAPMPEVGTDNSQLLGQVLGLLAHEGAVRMTDTCVALTESGYAVIEQAGRANLRLSEILQGRSSPAEGSGSSSLMLAIFRANFERLNKPNG